MVNYKLYQNSKDPNLKVGDVSFYTSIMSFLTSISMSAIGSYNYKHYEFNFSNKNSTMFLTCDSGIITIHPNMTKFGLVLKEESLKRISYTSDDSCTNYTNVIYDMQPCIGLNYCELSYNEAWIFNDEYLPENLSHQKSFFHYKEKIYSKCQERLKREKGVLSVYCRNRDKFEQSFFSVGSKMR